MDITPRITLLLSNNYSQRGVLGKNNSRKFYTLG